MEVDIHPFALQTVDGQQESLVVLNHQGLVAVCRIQLEGEEQSRINASQCFAGRLALGNEFFVCGSSFRLFLYFYLLFMGDTEEISFFQLLCFQCLLLIQNMSFLNCYFPLLMIVILLLLLLLLATSLMSLFHFSILVSSYFLIIHLKI